jgi:hypothetical protein
MFLMAGACLTRRNRFNLAGEYFIFDHALGDSLWRNHGCLVACNSQHKVKTGGSDVTRMPTALAMCGRTFLLPGVVRS